MTWSIKLKMGIFKTEDCWLSVQNEEIRLTPKAQGIDELILANDEIRVISLIEQNSGRYELELNTDRGMYLAMLAKDTDISELFGVFSQTFGVKFLVTRK